MQTRQRSFALILTLFWSALLLAQSQPHAIVLHAARMLDVESGKIVSPGEVLVEGERIEEAGAEGQRVPPARRSSTWATSRSCPG